MKYTIGSCKEKTQVDAPSIEIAFVEALKIFSLDKCNQFIYGYTEGKNIDDGDTMWGLTESYLKDAGYTQVKEHLWKKQNINIPSSGSDGLIQTKDVEPPTSPISQTKQEKKSISRTDYKEPSQQDITPEEQNQEQTNLSKSENLHTQRQTKKVNLKRTPEEWMEILNRAKK